jgi:hypothetical protein
MASPTRRSVIVASAAAGAASLLPAQASAQASAAPDNAAIRPFRKSI